MLYRNHTEEVTARIYAMECERREEREAAREVARMARDAYRDHLADLAIIQKQAEARFVAQQPAL